MKKFILYALFAGITFGYTACTGDFEEYNTNPYEPTDEQMENDLYIVRSILLTMEGMVVPSDNNLNQFTDCLLGGTYGGYLTDSNTGFIGKNFATYSAQKGWSSVPFNDLITKFYPSYNLLKVKTDDPVILSVADILKVGVMHRVTDIYGHIPYSEISKDYALTTPYDMQQDVYKKMFEELDAAIATLTENQTNNFSPKADQVFRGDVVQWVKFANSLKLRLAMRIVYADATLAQKMAEEAISHEIGVMGSNGDNAYFNIETKSPFEVVMYDYNGGDSRVSADITTYMNSYNDPRRQMYFAESSFSATHEDVEDGFYGLRNGINFSSSEEAHMYCNMNVKESGSFLHDKMMWMNAAEIAFLKAEGALRGWNMGGSVDALYEEGIRLSFEQWKASGVDTYLENEVDLPQSYVDPLGKNSYTGLASKVAVKWNSTGTPEEFEMDLERIITQKWIANFPLGLEAWADFRRTEYPRLMPVPHNLSNGVIGAEEFARRLPYPEKEYLGNTKNLQVALDNLNGPDNLATRVWWDSKPKNK